MNPEITFTLDEHDAEYAPEETLSGRLRVWLPTGCEPNAAEFLVLWETEGKGDTDSGIIHTESLGPPEQLRGTVERRFSVPLPLLPLTYHGKLVKVHWLARVRLRFRRGKDVVEDRPFVVRSRGTR